MGTWQTAAMRTTPRLASAALLGAALLVGCTSAANSQPTQPTTLATGSSGTTSSIVSPTGSTGTTTQPTATVVDTVPAEITEPSTTVLPTSTAPAGASVSIARGGFITKDHGSCTPISCKYVQITAAGWTPKQPLSVTCYSDSGSSGPYPKFADSSGNLSAATTCFFGNVTHVYVEIDGAKSNVVTPWKDW